MNHQTTSDTPETDAMHLEEFESLEIRYELLHDFARKLEREKSRLSALYHELLLSVESVHEGETRHQTALRYIRKRETFSCAPASDSSENVQEHAPLSVGASVDHGVDVGTKEDHGNRAPDRGCCVSSCSLSSIREAMLYAACDSEEGVILTPMNGTEIVLNDAEAKQLGEWLLHITSQDSRLRRSVDSSVTAACPSDDSTPNS